MGLWDSYHHCLHLLMLVFHFHALFPLNGSPHLASSRLVSFLLQLQLVTTLENKFRVMDMRTQHKEHGFASLSEKAHKSTVWLGRHLPQNRDLFMTAGGNGTVNLYKYSYPKSRQRKGLLSLSVSHPDLSIRISP